jgi:hypothetical protein
MSSGAAGDVKSPHGMQSESQQHIYRPVVGLNNTVSARFHFPQTEALLLIDGMLKNPNE